ncbi:hypothetical protein [Streptomyces microflavus]|uniref:hypothetical protein n=1 Tax=Streptomyces microflavus TaxID=1919 RepID=UPI002E31DDF5|nr:hypothetical protein [Streptomyces microflavus]
MRNSADRQARSRLARRRPGPHRIRRRASGARTGWRRIPWVHVGTVAGAVAAIGTVLFTGIATYYSAKIGSDQLDQSREDAERKARSQAEQVSFYVGGEGGAEDLHIVNRSPDPIYSPGVFFRTQVFDPRGDGSAYLRYYGAGGEGDLGPCSELVFKQSGIKAAHPSEQRHLVQWRPEVLGVDFIDRAGKRWYRTPEALTQRPNRAYEYKKSPLGTLPRGYAVGKPEVRDLKACGGSDS